MKKQWYVFVYVLTLGALVFGVYANILHNPPTNWDDPSLMGNTMLHSLSVENLQKALTLRGGSTFQPVRDISYMIDYTIWKADPVFGIHFDTIALYFLMLVALFFFLRELLRAFSVEEERGFAWAAIATIIYAVHPVHVECVAWLYARKEPLLGIFTFLSLWSFVRARVVRQGYMKYYAACIVALLLAVLSKPTALVAPGVMIVIDFALQAHRPSPGFWRRRLLLYVPVLLLVVPMIYRLVTMMMQAGGVKPWHGGSVWTNLFAVSQILVSYGWLICANISYVADYPIPLYASPGDWQAWSFAAVNLLVVLSVVWAFNRRHYLYVIFVAFYYVFLLPVAHIFPISQIIADRYALLSSLSWCVLLGFWLAKLWEMRLNHPRFSSDLPRLIAAALMAMIIVSYAFLTVQQNAIWRSSQRLWEHTLGRYPASSAANVNLGVIYIRMGRYEAAERLCINAIKILPYDYYAISNLALAQMLMGQYENAEHNYTQALKLKPDLFKARLGLANALWNLQRYEKIYALYQELIEQGGKGLVNATYGSMIYARYAYAAWKLGKSEDVDRSMQTAFDAAHVFPAMYREIAEIYSSMGLSARALESYHRYLAANKDAVDVDEIKALMQTLQDGN